jgi:hypothetical protein
MSLKTPETSTCCNISAAVIGFNTDAKNFTRLGFLPASGRFPPRLDFDLSDWALGALEGIAAA